MTTNGGRIGGSVGGRIGELRDGARNRMMETTRGEGGDVDVDEKKLKRLLHGPTMELREGKVVDLEVVLRRIEKEMMDGDT